MSLTFVRFARFLFFSFLFMFFFLGKGRGKDYRIVSSSFWTLEYEKR